MTAVSFLVCTRNRAASLERTMQAIVAMLASRPALACELVVVDNGSTDDTLPMARRIAEAAPVPVRLVPEPRPGLAVARNAGLRACRGRLIAMTDDDCVPEPSYLDDLVRHAAADPAPTLRGGRVVLGDPADLRFTVKDSRAAHRLEPDGHPAMVVLGCNMVIPRAIVDVVGPFDERFGAGAPLLAAEDTDYVYRAHRAGFAVEYVPDMVMQHFHGRRRVEEVRELELRYIFGNGAFSAKWALRDMRQARALLWTLRQSFNPWRRRITLRPDLGTTWGDTLDQTLRGAAAYAALALRGDRARTAAGG